MDPIFLLGPLCHAVSELFRIHNNMIELTVKTKPFLEDKPK